MEDGLPPLRTHIGEPARLIVSVSFSLAPIEGSERNSVFDDILFDMFFVPWVKTHG